tara:strand:+ start:240 stop:377 length:138 start_codon:yes stop_codon:yes gene_type:complete
MILDFKKEKKLFLFGKKNKITNTKYEIQKIKKNKKHTYLVIFKKI